MAIKKKPIEKNRGTTKRKNVFSAPSRGGKKSNFKRFDKNDRESYSSRFDKNKGTSSTSKGTEKDSPNRFKREGLAEDRFNTSKLSKEKPRSNNRTPIKKVKGFYNKEKDTKVYSSDKGKRIESYSRNKKNDEIEKRDPVNKYLKKEIKPRLFNRSEESVGNKKPYNRLQKHSDKPSPESQKEKREHKRSIKPAEKKFIKTQKFTKEIKPKVEKQDEVIRLNRYISNAGICSRREADKLISTGLVSVNGKVITEMGYQVKNSDDIRFNGQRLSREKRVYIIMNKPKDAIATLDDPDGRNTIMDLLGNEVRERVFPVGRLDRNTTGVIILTNDGELSQRLMHPKYEVEKVYKATLNKTFKGEDFWQLTNGVELEDGFIKPDELAYPDPKNKMEVGVLIHSGRNRIIHRMFEHLGYLLDKLDRVSYGGFVKTGLKRGEWRHLTDKEVTQLKRLSKLG